VPCRVERRARDQLGGLGMVVAVDGPRWPLPGRLELVGNNTLLLGASVAGVFQGGSGLVNASAQWSGATTTTMINNPMSASKGQQIGMVFATSNADFTIGLQLRRLAVQPMRVS
jgi:hypothetical protein